MYLDGNNQPASRGASAIVVSPRNSPLCFAHYAFSLHATSAINFKHANLKLQPSSSLVFTLLCDKVLNGAVRLLLSCICSPSFHLGNHSSRKKITPTATITVTKIIAPKINIPTYFTDWPIGTRFSGSLSLPGRTFAFNNKSEKM